MRRDYTKKRLYYTKKKLYEKKLYTKDHTI